MKGILAVLVLLAGCGLMGGYKHVKTEDGSGVYAITSLYDGSLAAKEDFPNG
jgi:hypothetical protein